MQAHQLRSPRSRPGTRATRSRIAAHGRSAGGHAACRREFLTTAATLVLATAPFPAAADVDALFASKCAACHAGGGNIVQAGATLQLGDMQRNGLLDVDAVYDLVYKGRGKMYGFGEGCAPKGKCTFGARLSDGDIQALSEYVVLQANRGWKQ